MRDRFVAVLLSPRLCDVDGLVESLQPETESNSSRLAVPASLRVPPLLSLSPPLAAAVVDSPVVKHAVVACVLSLLRTLLRVDDCMQINTRRQVGRMVRTRTVGQRRGKGWVGRKQGSEGQSSDDESDTESSFE